MISLGFSDLHLHLEVFLFNLLGFLWRNKEKMKDNYFGTEGV